MELTFYKEVSKESMNECISEMLTWRFRAQFGVEFYMLCGDHFQLNVLLESLEKLLTMIVLSLQCSNTFPCPFGSKWKI